MLNWHRYDVKVRFDDRLVGGIPVVPEGADRADAYEKWARGQGVVEDATFEETLVERLAQDPDMPVALATEDIAGPQTGFRRDEDGIYIEARQVKAMLREAAERLGYVKNVRGTRQVLQHDLHVRAPDGVSQKLRLGVSEPDGSDRRPIAVVTPQGPRTAIKYFDYVRERELSFQVKILAGGTGEGKIDAERLEAMLELGQSLGIGADRSQGEGTFTIVSFEPLPD